MAERLKCYSSILAERNKGEIKRSQAFLNLCQVYETSPKSSNLDKLALGETSVKGILLSELNSDASLVFSSTIAKGKINKYIIK